KKTDDLGAWLKDHLPPGGTLEGEHVFHTVSATDTPQSIAAAYLALTEIYLVTDLAKELAKKSIVPSHKIEIPAILTKARRDPKEERLGWPEDKAMRGIFLTGPAAQPKWQDYIDKVVTHGMNAIVLDGKDYDGWVTYASKAKIAVETGATKNFPIPDLTR